MPAILKGWVDRVYAYGFAYGVGEHSDKYWGDRFGEGTLVGKRAMLIVTNGGWEEHYAARGVNGPTGVNGMLNGKPLVAKEILSESGSPYPEPFASLATSSAFRQLGDQFGLTQLGVNLITLNPGAQSGLRHWHSLEDEFIYVLEGELTLCVSNGEFRLAGGMCVEGARSERASCGQSRQDCRSLPDHRIACAR
jgi:hypothetical protein